MFSDLLFSKNSRSIFLISVLGLFLELMLIRWIGTEIRIFAYLQNTVLVVCFLGLGIGCFTCQREATLRQILVPLFILVSILAIPQSRLVAAQITSYLSQMEDLLIWERTVDSNPYLTAVRVSLGLFLTLGMMVLLWEIFVPVGRILGRTMDSHKDVIKAYSINVAGSLVGIWLFVGLSSFWLPPVAWIVASAAMATYFLASGTTRKSELSLLAAIVAVSVWGTLSERSPEIAWSPYQKLELEDLREVKTECIGEYIILVNNAGYQGILDLDSERAARNPEFPKELVGYSQYDIPLMFHPSPKNVLIVGAGSGNDVAGALRNGAESVTAVEIDPAIINMGRKYHPEHPYNSPKVNVVNDDARSFFATTQDKYDLIIFGLLDSHTTTAMTNARLDHYVYTVESITRAKSLLSDGGVVALSFEALKPFIANRMGGCLREVFGQESLAFRIPANPTGWGGLMFVTGNMQNIQTGLAARPALQTNIAKWQHDFPVTLHSDTRIATDDWPYIYLESPRIPTLYYMLAALIPLLLVYAKHRSGASVMIGSWRRSEWHFALLGAAFLLLEVQNISKASVVLGNTWLVNAVVISGILCMILLANVIWTRFPGISPVLVGSGLLGSCFSLYMIDLSTFAFLPYTLKAVIVGGLTTVPLMFSGIIFARSFAATESRHRALGANLLGSIVGGMLQSLTFIVGIKALLLIVAGLYAAALLCAPVAGKKKEADRDNKLLNDEELQALLEAGQNVREPELLHV